mgnify:CR=1 FL=1
MFNIILVENNSMVRKLIELYIEKEKKYKLVASIDNLSNINQICITHKANLILMDTCIEMDVNGFEASKNIKKHIENIKIILMTDLPEYSFVKKAKDIGIDSFWYKEDDQYQLLKIMELTMEGKSVYPDRIPIVKLGAASSNDFTTSSCVIFLFFLDSARNLPIFS